MLVTAHGKWINWPHFLVSRIGPFLSKGGHVYCHIALVTYCQRRAKYIVTLVKYCHRRAMFTGYIDHLLEQSHSATSEATSCHPTAINTRNLWKFHNWMCMMIYHDDWDMKMKCQSAQSSQCSQSSQNGQKGESGVNWLTSIAASTRASNSGQETWKLTAKGRMWSSWQSHQQLSIDRLIVTHHWRCYWWK